MFLRQVWNRLKYSVSKLHRMTVSKMRQWMISWMRGCLQWLKQSCSCETYGSVNCGKMLVSVFGNIKIHNDASFKICSPYVSRVLNCDRKASIYNIVVHWCNFCPVTVCQFVRSNVFCRTFRRPIEAREGHHDEDRRYKAGDNFRPTFEHLNFRFHW